MQKGISMGMWKRVVRCAATNSLDQNAMPKRLVPKLLPGNEGATNLTMHPRFRFTLGDDRGFCFGEFDQAGFDVGVGGEEFGEPDVGRVMPGFGFKETTEELG